MLQYIVQPGDTIYFIALKFKISVQRVLEVNNIRDPNSIYPGQMLQIPLPYSAQGDTSNFPSLGKGSTGPFVILLQGQLAKLGYYIGPLDGIFSTSTEGSVIQYQLSRSLQPTGMVSPTTWKELLSEVEASLNSPPFQGKMALSGIFMLLSLDKPTYHPGDTMEMTLFKLNLTAKPITLQYTSGQRYDYKITYPSGRSLWRWSEDKSFTQAMGTLTLAPGQSIRYMESFQIPPAQEAGLYHVFGWNTAKQISHQKLHLPIQLSE